MCDLISRSALMKELARNSIVKIVVVGEKTVWDIVKDQPTIEAVEVVHGEWHLLDDCSNAGVYCSICHKKVYRKDYANQKVKSNFCPNCGADMRKGGEEHE